MKRRRFLHIAAAGTIAGATAPAAAASAAIDPALDALAHPDILWRIGTHRLIRRLGEAYLREHPGENDADVLAGRILPGLHERSAASDVPQNLRLQLEHRARVDYAEGRTVQLCGWIVSKTEARQCALYSLLYA